MFTAEPTTADATRMIIEGSRGLGESVVGGAVIPDNWIVDATQFAIVDRTIAPRPPGDAPARDVPADGAQSSEENEQQGCLLDQEVLELARVGKLVEAHFGKPQDIEWAIDRGATGNPVFILQARPETFRISFRF
jgi:pyruvate,water dikinase